MATSGAEALAPAMHQKRLPNLDSLNFETVTFTPKQIRTLFAVSWPNLQDLAFTDCEEISKFSMGVHVAFMSFCPALPKPNGRCP